MKTLEVLERITDKDWRRVDETMNRIMNYAIPTTIKQLMAFYDLANRMRDYLPNLGERMQPFMH